MSKKFTKVILASALCVSIFSVGVGAAPLIAKVTATLQTKANIGSASNVQALSYNNDTYVPVSKLTNVGIKATYDSRKTLVTLSQSTKYTPSTKSLKVNCENQGTIEPVLSINGKTYISLSDIPGLTGTTATEDGKTIWLGATTTNNLDATKFTTKYSDSTNFAATRSIPIKEFTNTETQETEQVKSGFVMMNPGWNSDWGKDEDFTLKDGTSYKTMTTTLWFDPKASLGQGQGANIRIYDCDTKVVLGSAHVNAGEFKSITMDISGAKKIGVDVKPDTTQGYSSTKGLTTGLYLLNPTLSY